MTHHPERLVTVGELQLCHDAFGEPEHPPMLLVMGLGFQLVHWPEDLCRQLAAEGFRVIRFDNRDAGRSTHLPGQRYSVDDMADDAVGLLDALGIDSAHVVGASLGGMIAQTMAIRHPRRVRSLASPDFSCAKPGKEMSLILPGRPSAVRPPEARTTDCSAPSVIPGS